MDNYNYNLILLSNVKLKELCNNLLQYTNNNQYIFYYHSHNY